LPDDIVPPLQGTNEGLPVWYVMDEFGSRIQHSDMPSFKMAPLMYAPQGTAYSIIWPVKDLDQGGRFICAHCIGQLFSLADGVCALFREEIKYIGGHY